MDNMRNWDIDGHCVVLGFSQETKAGLLARTLKFFNVYESSVKPITPNQLPYLQTAQECAAKFLQDEVPGFWLPGSADKLMLGPEWPKDSLL